VVKVEDAAGVVETPRYGAFGEPLETERTLTATPGTDPDWSGSVTLESSGHKSISAFDALGRRARAWLPDGTERQEDYLRSGPLAALRVITPDTTTRTILESAEYNARGQQTFAELGNGVEIAQTYDAQTFRLYRRLAVTSGGSTYQDLRHHYDPVGNLVYLDDLAQSSTATHVISGLASNVPTKRVYKHDTRYQLTEATGRVHESLTKPDFRGDAPTSGSYRGTRRIDLNDGHKVKRYKRVYTYDDAGNLEIWTHGPEAMGGSIATWNNELWVDGASNRSFPKKDLNGIAYPSPGDFFNTRGQITALPNVAEMEWSARDQLRRTLLIERPSDPDDEELYDYAADETRLRKTTRRWSTAHSVLETTETVYLDGCELRRITQGSTVILERWSAHAGSEEERLATVYFWDSDTQSRETSNVNAVREHFHLGSRLGSVKLEVDGTGALLAYEEYFRFGRTAFVAGDAAVQVAFRTRRFVGKDQDDATGFYVFQFRYYAPFIGNWVSPDPAGEVDGPNRYWYARNNPATLIDPYGLQVEEAPRRIQYVFIPRATTTDTDSSPSDDGESEGTSAPPPPSQGMDDTRRSADTSADQRRGSGVRPAVDREGDGTTSERPEPEPSREEQQRLADAFGLEPYQLDSLFDEDAQPTVPPQLPSYQAQDEFRDWRRGGAGLQPPQVSSADLNAQQARFERRFEAPESRPERPSSTDRIDYLGPTPRDPTGQERDLQTYRAPRGTTAANAVRIIDSQNPRGDIYICEGHCRWGESPRSQTDLLQALGRAYSNSIPSAADPPGIPVLSELNGAIDAADTVERATRVPRSDLEATERTEAQAELGLAGGTAAVALGAGAIGGGTLGLGRGSGGGGRRRLGRPATRARWRARANARTRRGAGRRYRRAASARHARRTRRAPAEGGGAAARYAGGIDPTEGNRLADSLRRSTGLDRTARGRSRNVAFAESVIDGRRELRAAVSGRGEVPGTVPEPSTRRFTTRDSGAMSRANDTEVKLLEDIAAGLSPDSRGVIHLFTERPPCFSCRGVIDQFRQAFPNVEVIVTNGGR